MKLSIVAVGNLKEQYLKDGAKEYLKRLTPIGGVAITEVNPEKAPETLTNAQRDNVLKLEGERLLKRINPKDFVVCLDVCGKQMPSEEFADFLSKRMGQGDNVTFVIGGSEGLYRGVKSRADFSLSFSQMTFPHQLMRVILLEQIYRAFKIIRNEPYHK